MGKAFWIYISAMLALALTMLFLGFATPVHALQAIPLGCGPRLAVIAALKKQYGMEERWFGIEAGNQASVSMLLVNNAGSWVSLRVQPEVACIVAKGEDSTLMFGTPA